MNNRSPVNPSKIFRRNYKGQAGYVLLLAVIFLGIFLALSAALIGYTTLNLRGSRVAYYKTQSLYLAEAGVEKALTELNKDSNFSGMNNQPLGGGVYSVNVATVGLNQKKIVSTGYVPDSVAPQAARTIIAMAAIDNASVSFNYGVQVGAGGLIMDNNSGIAGNVFSNGSITGGNGSTTGDVIVAEGTSPEPDQQWTVQNQEFSFGDIASEQDVAQSFKPARSDKLNKIQVYLRKIGSPGDLTVRMMTNDVDHPSKTTIASSNISASLVTGGFGWIEASFASPPNLSAGADYWLMLSAPSISGGNYYIWGSDSNKGYGNGVAKYSDNWNSSHAAWNEINGDMNYKTFLGGVITFMDSSIKVGGNLTATEVRKCGGVAGTAYYNTLYANCSAGSAVGGNTAPGPGTLPISQAQIDGWKNAAESGGTLAGPYAINGFQTLGPIKIDGDLILNGGSTLDLTGPIWVKGNININNNSIVRVNASLGNSGSVLLADNPLNPSGSGIITISNNAIIEGNGNPNSYPMILTASSNLTGAMYINNNATAAIYYAANGRIEISNNAGGNQITGYGIHMNNNAAINYQTGLRNATFSNGPGASWRLLPGSYYIKP